jgi:uncharacterized lipoprotein YehR (DUF1307 family)
MLKKVVLIMAAVMLFGYVTKAQNVPDVAGIWKVSNGAVINMKQDGKKISWNMKDNGFTYSFTGSYKGDDVFKGSIERKNNSTGCTTYIKAVYTLQSESKLHYLGTGMDNQCDLRTTFSETFIFTKED